MKKGARIGYIIGLVLAIPLIIFLVNTFFLKGNNISEQQIDSYIQNSEIITLDIPEKTKFDNEQFTPRLSRRSSSAFLKRYTFYSQEYQKHFVLVTFTRFEKNDHLRFKVLFRDYYKITTRVNKQQLASSEYGTELKPVPVFPLDVLEIEDKEPHADLIKIFHLSEKMYRIYVQQYLNRFTEKEDLIKLFGEK